LIDFKNSITLHTAGHLPGHLV